MLSTLPSNSGTEVCSPDSALGVNDRDQVVGFYTVGKSTMHGFLWHDGAFVTINDPNGLSSTTINGTNSLGDIVGLYTDSSGNTDGFIGAPPFRGYANVAGS
jgi:probable HAF family extracellular repeat protein